MAKRRRRKKVAMATRRKVSRKLKAYHRKEKARRAKISKSLKAYHRQKRRAAEPLRKVVRIEEVRRPEPSLGDFILQAIRDLQTQQKPAKFELLEGRQVGGFDMKDQHPDLPRLFARHTQASVETHYVYFTDDGDLQENTITLYFDTGANDEEFWHNYHSVIRDELDVETADIEGGYQDFAVFVARVV